MQNIDFSSQIRKRSNIMSGSTTNSGTKNSSQNASGSIFTFSNRWVSGSFAVIVVVFSLGLYSGLKIGTIRQIEKSDCIVRYPDSNKNSKKMIQTVPNQAAQSQNQPQKESNSKSLSNTGNTPELTYIIKVGSFNQKGAHKLTQQLNNVSEIRTLKPLACKGVQEIEPDRGVAFRMTDSKNKGKENVLIGCFKTAGRANHVLDLVRKSGLPGSSNAQLYEY